MPSAVELSIPPNPEFVALARLFISTFVSNRRDVEDDRIDDLRLAVSEACTNAVESHVAAGIADPVVIRIEESADQVRVHVVDQGGGFDADTLPAHPPVTDPQRLNFERGLGVPLIRSLVDGAEFKSRDAGTDVALALVCEPAAAAPAG